MPSGTLAGVSRSRRPPLRGRPYEAEVLPGLGPFVRDELAVLPHASLAEDGVDLATTDRLSFGWSGPGDPPLARLRTATSLQRVVRFDVPRPKALLGDAAFRRLADEAREVARLHGPFDGLRIEAAGRDSHVFRRLRATLADALGLADDPEGGELRLRVRAAPDDDGEPAWEVLIRTSPRPGSARAWRVRNLPGGLNACVAAAAWRWLGVGADQRIVNAMCGSGTLAIERAALGPFARLVGIDLDADALEATAENAAAAGLQVDSDLAPAAREDGRAVLALRLADATATDLASASFDVLVADPPWGDAIGEVGELPALYRALLAEAARLVRPGGQALIVSHALRAFEGVLHDASQAWRPNGELRVFHGGHRPALYRLKRRA